MAKILSVYNRLQAGDYENGNGGKRKVSRLTQFIYATLQLLLDCDYCPDSDITWRPGSRAVDKLRRNAAELGSSVHHFELLSGVDLW